MDWPLDTSSPVIQLRQEMAISYLQICHRVVGRHGHLLNGCSSIHFPVHCSRSNTITSIPIRLKSSHSRQLSPATTPANKTWNIHERIRRNPKQPPTPPTREDVANLYEVPRQPSGLWKHLHNWRYSPLFLTFLVNVPAFIIFALWVREAHRSAKAKKDDNVGKEDDRKGDFAAGIIQDVRYVTPGQEWLLDNFTVTPINIREGRYWCLITSLFSHQMPSHFALNIFVTHVMFKSLCPVFGTIPVATSFLVGGVLGNAIIAAWMSLRGKNNYKEKYPGQFFGELGMNSANLSVMGFAAGIWPKWEVKVYGVVPVKIGWVMIGAWIYEAYQYWVQEGWEKIQSSVTFLVRVLLTLQA